MNKYLLLRSNKQTGPYTLEEIRGMGLKAYDLIWVDGKSAAWRYPGEIEELKSFAPPVEEQPFDRFFKKPTQTNQPLISSTQAAYMAREEQAQAAHKTEAGNLPATAKPVFVSGPTPTRIVLEKRPESPAIPARTTGGIHFEFDDLQEEKFAPKTRESIPPARATSGNYAAAFSERIPQETSATTDRYPERSASRNRNPSGSSLGAFLKPFAIGFGLAAFLGIGIFIGLSLNNRGTNSTKDKDIGIKDEAGTANQTALYHPQNIPLVTPPVQDDKSFDNTVPAQMDEQKAAKEQAALEERKKARAKQRVADSLLALKPKMVADSSTLQAATHVTRIPEAALAKEAVKNNIGSYVNLSGNKYNVGTFGGISDLQLTVSNRSIYGLDLVVVEVQYIQSNKKIFKTENLYFRNIGAGSALMEEAPKSSRGVKVQYRITVINSKELGLAYSGI